MDKLITEVKPDHIVAFTFPSHQGNIVIDFTNENPVVLIRTKDSGDSEKYEFTFKKEATS